ncbi:DUF6455 family protein [Salinarimonas ramus]|uniref:DUF6455 domain-containing protein n=1 Tax=Salinarimonas ramus TaxID=690164 RepID=A0A917Q4L9_9HYPH|nr:DUF6455 family protein [Salinarimonas ramus]GGK21382.1 hypothetical protein GCM10011322_05060 [Salinarimonas ramus]
MRRNEGETGAGALHARVETHTLLIMEMMRRLGVSRGEAQDEAARAAHADAEATCAACGEKAACAAYLAGEHPLVEEPLFCANLGYMRDARGN